MAASEGSTTATCPACGFSKLLLKETACLACGKRGCEKCLFTFGTVQPDPSKDILAQRVCSWPCFDRWASGVIAQGYTPMPWGQSWILRDTVLHPQYVPRLRVMAEERRVNLQLQHAKNLVTAERFEDAAKVYESLGLWKEAGDVRRTGKRTVVTQVQVDLNSLIDQMRRGGLTTAYTCPSCQSPIRITPDTDAGSLRHCRHCGSVIQTTDLAEFLGRVVGSP